MAEIKVSSAHQVLDSHQIPTPESFKPSKPVLSRMIDFHISFGKVGDNASRTHLDSIDHKREANQVWIKDLMEHKIKEANRTWLEHGWLLVKTIADSIISVISFAVGGYCIANGNTSAGSLLIATGVFNILQTVFAKDGMKDWITETLAEKNEAVRERLKMAFPIIVSLLGLGFSIASSRYSIQPTTALATQLKSIQELISAGGQIVNSIFSIQKGFDNASLTVIQGEIKKYEQIIDQLFHQLELCIRGTRDAKSKIKKPINAFMQATTLATNKV